MDPLPEKRRWRAFPRFPLIDDGLTGGAHQARESSLADVEVIFPGESGQVDYAAHVTFRTCRLSNALGLRYPSDECSRYGL